jgi:hypothetical protein
MPFFADTNVCSKWESDTAVHQNWLAAKRTLESRGQEYVSCPLVLVELLSTLVKPEPQYFSSDLKSFLFLSNDGGARFLTSPAKFALKQVLQVGSPISPFDSADFKQWCAIITASSSREALTNGEVEMGSPLLTYGVDFAKIKTQHEAGRKAFVERMAYLRQNRVRPTPLQVARSILRWQNVIPQPADADKLARALDAAYQYEMFLLRTDTSYDFGAERHRGDWIDSQLLYYLADTDMHILTDDAKLKKWCVSSHQADRILVL